MDAESRAERILLVGDAPGLVEVLRRAGFEIDLVATTGEALGHLAQTRVDLVVTDVRGPGPTAATGLTVRAMERRLILETLARTRNNRTQAAKVLGISIRTLRNKLAEYRAHDAPGLASEPGS
jgi:DNA-binding NtrC family response regulator